MFNKLELHKSLAADEEFITDDLMTWAGGQGVVSVQSGNASENWSAKFCWNNGLVHEFHFDPNGAGPAVQFNLPPGNISMIYKELGGVDPVDFVVTITAVTNLVQPIDG